MDILIEAAESDPKELQIKAAPEKIELVYDLAQLVKEVVYDATIRRVGDEVFLNGYLNFTLRYTCARCLNEFDQSYRQLLDLVLQLVPEEQVPKDVQDDFVLVPSNQKTYDLTSQVREIITLSLPMKPLCREDCQGLCSQCGTNLNENNCDCHKERIDPRWEKLREISGQE
jgi:uncharacterized protein